MLKDDHLFGPEDIPPDWIELEKIPRRAWEQTLARSIANSAPNVQWAFAFAATTTSG